MSAASQIREAALRGDRSTSRRQAVTFLLLLGCPTRTMSAALHASRRPCHPRPQWAGWQTKLLADWQTGRRADGGRAKGTYRECAACSLPGASAQLVPHGWGMAICISPARQAFLPLHTIASFRAARFLELHLAVTQMSLRFPRVGSLCHTPSGPSQS